MDVKITVSGIEDCIAYINSIPNLINNNEFKQYIGEKCVEEIKTIAKEKLGHYDNYIDHNQIEILKTGILIYNDVQNVAGDYYSLILEYGSGTKADEEYQTGKIYWYVPQTLGPDLENYNYKSFELENGEKIYMVYGQEPKHIYNEAAQIISQKITKWVVEYVKSNITKL